MTMDTHGVFESGGAMNGDLVDVARLPRGAHLRAVWTESSRVSSGRMTQRCPARLARVELTDSYKRAFPKDVLKRYDMRETRQAAAVLQNTNPTEFRQL